MCCVSPCLHRKQHDNLLVLNGVSRIAFSVDKMFNYNGFLGVFNVLCRVVSVASGAEAVYV